MSRYIIRRLLLMVPVLIGVSLVVFFMIRLIPGDPALALAGEHATPETVQMIRARFGLDQPLPVQYWAFVSNAVRGDLGRSTRTRRPVAQELGNQYPNTLLLAAAALGVSIAVGISSGILAAVKQHTWWDTGVMVFALFGVSMPVFWMGLMMMYLFSVQLRWLPTAGMGTPAHLVLPAITLGMSSAGMLARMTRSAMLEVLRQDYIRTARSKGITEFVIVMKHGLRNSLIPIVTVLGLQFGTLLGGAVLTETVFAWPGVGRLMVEAIMSRDYPIVQGAVLLVAISFIMINLIVDVTYVYLDPAIKYD